MRCIGTTMSSAARTTGSRNPKTSPAGSSTRATATTREDGDPAQLSSTLGSLATVEAMHAPDEAVAPAD